LTISVILFFVSLFFSNAPAAATLCVIDLPRKKIALYSSKNKRRKGKKKFGSPTSISTTHAGSRMSFHICAITTTELPNETILDYTFISEENFLLVIALTSKG
jgi:hypothetical protein